jgi:hypothetical protein
MTSELLAGEVGETLAGAVRSTPTHKTGKRAPRFTASTFVPVIRGARIGWLGCATPEGRRNEPPLVDAVEQGYERRAIFRLR